MKARIIGAILVLSAAIIFFLVWYLNTPKREVPIVFSVQNMLASLWRDYKVNFIEPNTDRTIDTGNNNVTTSEGQSYTMLRAVWMDDKDMFDRSWSWTQQNLQRTDDNLFSWLYGTTTDGYTGILTDRGGENTASDGDSDIALALIFAYERWSDREYLDAAYDIVRDIWAKEIIVIRNRPYLLANNVELTSGAPTVVVNPSYFSPYAYKIFARIDPTHDWLGVASTSYDLLFETSRLPLDKDRSSGLPPDWIRLNRTTGALSTTTEGSQTTNYGFDALRVPWRIALDWQWFKDQRAKQYLDSLAFLENEWKANHIIYSTYSHDGKPQVSFETPAMYGGAMGYFYLHQDVGKEVYEEKLKLIYSPDFQAWKEPIGYYNDNWAWFGMALYNERLPNLAERLFATSTARQ